MHRAYAPYSKFPVGAAGLVDDGRVVVGCNVENAAYGVVLCAECGMVSQLHATGGGRLIAMACVDADGEPLLPCGRCRQLLWENGGPAMLVDSKIGPLTMDYLLPHGFGREDLDAIIAPAAHSAFSEPEPDDDWPKRPPSRNVKKMAAEPEPAKARAPKKPTLRDLDAIEPETDAPRSRKQGGRTTPSLATAAVPASATERGAAQAATAAGRRAAKPLSAKAVKGGAAEAGSGRAAKVGAGEATPANAAERGAAKPLSAKAVKGGAAEAVSGRAAKGGAAEAASGGGAERGVGGAGSRGVAAKRGGKAAGLGVAEEDVAAQRQAGAGKARGKGAAR
ncbi:hypothetical protein Rhe02_88960 [Rhizocola hellebori]|uniref:CMP/dCMP-type deaminase domain-containing protein n=2 Tax=Rhizocola hellebori TaxID=1392758 RepID=A0A8J3QGT3_9ACTN|nr:hypothetical protein Rhe02_88960 [Rhizocola hellebori]